MGTVQKILMVRKNTASFDTKLVQKIRGERSEKSLKKEEMTYKKKEKSRKKGDEIKFEKKQRLYVSRKRRSEG